MRRDLLQAILHILESVTPDRRNQSILTPVMGAKEQYKEQQQGVHVWLRLRNVKPRREECPFSDSP